MRGIGFDGRLAVGETMIYNKAKKTFSVSPVLEIGEGRVYYKRDSEGRFINSEGVQFLGTLYKGFALYRDAISVNP